MGKKVNLLIHFGGCMRKVDDTYEYVSELGCELVEWELVKIKWDSFGDFCFSMKISAPIVLIYYKDASEDMSKVKYAYESILMEDLHAMLCVAEVDGTMEIFLEHEASEYMPGVVHYLVSSQHEDKEGEETVRDENESVRDQNESVRDRDRVDTDTVRVENDETEGDGDDEADDEAHDDSEEESEGEDDLHQKPEQVHDDTPKEDVDPEPSEDEYPNEEDENNNPEVHENENNDDGDDVVADEGDGGKDQRFKEVFKEGEALKDPIEDKEEKERQRKEAEESDEDYEGYRQGDGLYPDPPAASDEEWDDWMDKRRFKGKGPTRFHGDLTKEPFLWLFQTFNSGLEFKDQLLRYSLNTQYDVKMAKSEKDRIACVCCNKECKWRVFCSIEKPLKKWMVKVCKMHHNHGKSSRVSMLKQGVIAGLFREELRRNVGLPASEIKDIIKARYNIVVPIGKCYRGRRIALDSILEAQAIQFGLLWSYENELKVEHPRITTELLTRVVDGAHMFDCFYICFEELRDSWRQNCRPVIGIDGCFLKWELNGDLLAAVGRDADNRMYPIAWAVVRGETKETWGWFLQKLKADLHLGVGDGFTVISDKQKGLVAAMEKELPKAEHRMCARHIYANWSKTFSRSEYKNLFWGVAYSYNKGDFKKKMKEVEAYDPAAHQALENLEPQKWSRAYFDTTSRCHDVHNNLSEAFNRTIKIARTKPVLSMLEDIRRQAMRRNTRRYFKARRWDTLLTPITMDILEKARTDNAYCSTIRSSENLYEVVEFDHGYTVRMLSHECAYRKWDLTGLPCKHAICVMNDNEEDAEQYVVNFYHCSVMRSTYNENIKPVNGRELWTEVNKPVIGVPEFRKPRGRPKKRDRRKEPFEDLANAEKSTRHGREQHCSKCGEPGHTKRSCKNEEVVVEGPKNKRGRPKKFPEKQPVRPKRPTKPRKKKAGATGTSSTQPVQGVDSGCSFPASSSAPEPTVANNKQAKKRKRGPALEISNAVNIPTVSATLMSPFTSNRFDAFSSIARGSKPPSEPNQP